MAENKPSLPFGRAELGDADDYYHLRYPHLNSNGTIYFFPQDGTNPLYVKGKSAVHFYRENSVGLSLTHTLNRMSSEKMSVIIHDVTLIVTNARVIYQSLDRKNPAVHYVGHLWFPWITEVGFRPKQSFLNDSVLEIGYQENFKLAERGMWTHRIELDFDKHFHPGDLAQQIVRRIAAHHLREGVPEEAKPELTSLLDAPRLDDPEKDEIASYYLPAFVAIPGGVPYIPSARELTWSWLGPNIPWENDNEDSTVDEDHSPLTFRPENPVYDSAAASASENGTPDDSTELPAAGLDQESAPVPPALALDRRTRSQVLSTAVSAMFAHRAESYEISAQLHDQVLESTGWRDPRIAVIRFRDLVNRCLEAHSRLEDSDTYRERALRALECAHDERDEELEFRVRRHLAETLKSEPDHEEFTANLHRLSELSDDWCTRAERLSIHRSVALQAKNHDLIGRAWIEFGLIADLHRSLGNDSASAISLQWQSLMARRAGQHELADEKWVSGATLLATSADGDPGDLTPPGPFDLMDFEVRKAVIRARNEALECGSSTLLPGHLLLGAASTDNPTRALLAHHGISPEKVLTLLDAGARAKSTEIPRSPAFTDETRAVIDGLAELARLHYRGHISMMLLLSGLLEDESVAQLVDEIGADLDALRAEVRNELE